MASMLDYLDWRGDISFTRAPFNEVDNAILAQLSYLDLTGIVPSVEEGGSITVAEAAEKYQALGRYDEANNYEGVIDPLTRYLPAKMAAGRRFASMRLSKLRTTFDEKNQEQFFAFHASLPHHTTYISFRGTDNTLLGWRENFAMTYTTAAAQIEALQYLHATCKNPLQKIMLGGHSKGANLAMYAGALARPQLQKRIVKIWDNDGPGFREQTLPREALAAIRPKIYTILPVFDVVGQLLYAPKPDKIVESAEEGIYQHSALSWLVQKDTFVAANTQEIKEEAAPISQAFNSWFRSASPQKRRAVFTEFFDMLDRARIQTLGELLSADPKVLAGIVQELPNISKETRDYALDLFRRLAGNIANNKFQNFSKKMRKTTTAAEKLAGDFAQGTREAVSGRVRDFVRGAKDVTNERVGDLIKGAREAADNLAEDFIQETKGIAGKLSADFMDNVVKTRSRKWDPRGDPKRGPKREPEGNPAKKLGGKSKK